MPRCIIKADPDRDAYLEWSTVVDCPVSIGTRADYVAQYGEERMFRTDKHGTSAMWFDWIPGTEQTGGWDDDLLLVANIGHGTLPRDRLGALYDLLAEDINATIPADWLKPFDDEDEQP